LKKLVKNKEDLDKSEQKKKKEEEKTSGDTQNKEKETPIISSTDDDFYKKILEGLGAPITDENLKFLYGWRQAEKGTAKNNPFNTTFSLTKDTNMSDYNSAKVKNYSKPEYGIEATVKTLQSTKYDYSCIVNGLKNNIGAKKISECPALDMWGTGDLVAKVIDGYDSGASFKNPPIVRT